MSDYRLTVGLEIHAELRTKTKMFCDSRNDPDETRPNVNLCPVCLGHPGTLPVINKKAVKQVLTVGLALGGTLADFTEFDRKNYFYPDIPKGYQLSQYEFPLVRGGSLNGVAVTRVHLEEDTATSLHRDHSDSPFTKGSTASSQEGFSLVDFNRAGVPLMELVTEPVIRSAKQAGDFARELQLLLRYLGASDANMEKGEMRVEANVSAGTETADKRRLDADSREKKSKALGVKVEIKNLNSFRAVERAIAYEYKRQIALLEAGEEVVQETRGWDETKGVTFSQRRKEESRDYRYFPDPDLPKLALRDIAAFSSETLRKEMPELPAKKRRRYRELGIKAEDGETLVANRALGALFEQTAENLEKREQVLLAANYLTSDLIGLIKKAKSDPDSVVLRFTPDAFARLMRMVGKGELSSRGAKDTLSSMFESGGNPEVIASEKGVLQESDAGELEGIARAILSDNGKVAADYRAGKQAALQFLVGQGMKATRGAANPEALRKVFERLLKYCELRNY